MIDLSPIDWVTTLPPINNLKWRFTDTRMIAVVVRKLSRRKVGVLTLTEIYNTGSQRIIERLDGPLALSVSLQKIRNTKVQPRTQFLVEPLPKSRSEPNISIIYNRNRNPISNNNLAHIYIDQFISRGALPNS